MIKAKLANLQQNGRNYSGDKELIGAYTVLGKIKGEMREIVTARAYMGRSRSASTVYASIWISAPNIYAAGHGSAGGYGYHKESAAFADAIRSAGVELFGSPYSGNTWNYEEKRAYTPAELRKMNRENLKRRCHIGGVGDSAMRAAFEAIARACGARGKLNFVRH